MNMQESIIQWASFFSSIWWVQKNCSAFFWREEIAKVTHFRPPPLMRGRRMWLFQFSLDILGSIQLIDMRPSLHTINFMKLVAMSLCHINAIYECKGEEIWQTMDNCNEFHLSQKKGFGCGFLCGIRLLNNTIGTYAKRGTHAHTHTTLTRLIMCHMNWKFIVYRKCNYFRFLSVTFHVRFVILLDCMQLWLQWSKWNGFDVAKNKLEHRAQLKVKKLHTETMSNSSVLKLRYCQETTEGNQWHFCRDMVEWEMQERMR